MNITKLIPPFVKWLIIKFYLKLKFKSVWIGYNARTDFNTFFEGNNVLQKNSKFFNSKIGLGSYIAGNTQLDNVLIGNFCAIGNNIRNNFGVHPSKDFVSIHPAFFSINKQAGFTFVNETIFEEQKFIFENGKRYKVIIGNDVWIGSDVLIMDGVKIGDGVIIAAGSVITKNIEDFSIVGGVPAKLIRKRFSEEQIHFLQKFKWWNKGMDWLAQHKDLFRDIEKLMNYESNKNNKN